MHLKNRLIGLHPRDRLGSFADGLSVGLPEDLQEQAIRRVTFVALMWGAALLVSVTVNALLHIIADAPMPPAANAVRGVSMLGSAATVVALRSSRLSLAVKCDLGIIFQIFGAASLTSFELSTLPSLGISVGHISSAALWIVVFGLLVPNPMVKALLGGLLAAAAVPCAVWLQRRLGAEVLPWPNSVYLGSSFAAAVLAATASRQSYHIGEAVKEVRMLGSYQLEELLGSGGMGEVWRASHGLLRRPGAIKLIQPDTLGASDDASRAAALKRFELEAQATAELGSTHTVTLYDFGKTRDGAFYYVMELLDGLDLDTLVELHGAQPAARVASILKQICHSLMDAHRRGMIHRDVKPTNVFTCRLGPDVDFIKVLDFGLVKHIDPERGATTRLTRDGVVTGTPAFMPPEVALGSVPADERSDIYMLGCVGYFLLTGEQVFDGDTAVAIISHHIHTEPVPVAERAEQDVPAVLAELVMSCLAKAPKQRPESAAAIWQRLDEERLDQAWTRARAHSWWDEHRPVNR